MGLSVFIPAAAALANAVLSALVFLNRPKAPVNRLFALTALAAAGWAGTNVLFQATDSNTVAMLTAQASSVCSLLMSASFLHFSWVYPVYGHLNRRWVYALWTLALLLSVLSTWPGAVNRAIDLSGTHRIITAPGFYFIALFLFGTALFAFVLFFRHMRQLHGTLHQQALYVLTGSGLTALCGVIFNIGFPLFGDYRLVWLGPSCSVFFVAGTVYSIIAHHLFDIRLIIKRTVVYSLLLAAISAAYSATEYLLTELFASQSQGNSGPLFAHIAGAIVVSLGVSPVRKWLERKIHHLLYPKQKTHRKAHPFDHTR